MELNSMPFSAFTMDYNELEEDNSTANTPSNKSRKVINSEGREMIARVFHFLRDEYNFMKENNPDNCDLSPLSNIRKRTAEATGISERTVTRILKEEKELPSTGYKFISPMTKRRRRVAKVDVDDITVDVIHSIIQNYHREHNKIPTLAKLQSIFKERFEFTGCLSTLRTLLVKIGYKYSKTENNRWTLENSTESHKPPKQRRTSKSHKTPKISRSPKFSKTHAIPGSQSVSTTHNTIANTHATQITHTTPASHITHITNTVPTSHTPLQQYKTPKTLKSHMNQNFQIMNLM